MVSYRYADVLLPLPIYGTFTYAVEREKSIGLIAGIRVSVPFGKKNTYTALIISIHDDRPSDYETREIISILDLEPVVIPSQLALWKWMSEYYMCPLGEIFKAAMPGGLELSRKSRHKPEKDTGPNEISILNAAQRQALEEINTAFLQSEVALLHGITSSGKTEIYIHLIREALDRNLQVLYLLPEIALTTQIITRLRKAFGPRVAIYHSKYSNSERIKTWKKMLNWNTTGDQNVQVVLGVR
jgi:primosomal protein N' (replication factor Y)